jgi:hypothetical protein
VSLLHDPDTVWTPNEMVPAYQFCDYIARKQLVTALKGLVTLAQRSSKIA